MYSINCEDLQQVASEKLGRELTRSEMRLVEAKLGDHVDWFGAIEAAIGDVVGRC